jgi:hypothetical protein
MGVGANHNPTIVELISTTAIGTRKKNSPKKTTTTYQSPPLIARLPDEGQLRDGERRFDSGDDTGAGHHHVECS